MPVKSFIVQTQNKYESIIEIVVQLGEDYRLLKSFKNYDKNLIGESRRKFKMMKQMRCHKFLVKLY